MKNNLIILIICYFFFNSFSLAETFTFETAKIEINDGGNLIYAENGKAISSNNNLEINSDKFEYRKKLNILKAYGNGVAFIKSENIKIEFDNAIVDQNTSTIKASGDIKIYHLDENLIIKTSNIIYDNKNSLITSDTKSILTDKQKNIYSVDNFNYEINKNLLKVENINFKDNENNNFKTSLAYINTKTNRLFGKDVIVNLNNTSFAKNNEPRFKGNSVINDKNSTEVTKGIFTTCKRRDGCPPWQLSAETIQHDKKEKVINYKNAVLRLYDVPVMYFPKFFHPDPTVKRESGFLVPTFKNSPNSDNYLNVPYFLVIAENKDITFSPRFYTEDKLLLQTEYRQINAKSTHNSDFSFYNQENSSLRNHFFYNYTKKFEAKNFEESNLILDLQQTSHENYLKTNKLKSNLLSDNSVLENSLGINLYSNNLSINTEMTVYEDLSKSSSDKYEYILPKFDLVKKFENKTKLDGDFSFRSQNLLRNYNTNIFEKININDFVFNSFPKISKSGFYNNYDFIIKNSNTDTQKSTNYKDDENYYLSGLFQFNSSIPLIKESQIYQNILKPRMSIKISPKNTKDIKDQETRIDVNNIYELDRISENDTLEGGISIAYGNDYSIFNKNKSREVFNFKIANNLRFKTNDDLPRNNQIHQKTSNFFSEIIYSPNDYLTTRYNTSIKNNLSDVEYQSLITEFKINNLVTTFDYLNDNNSSITQNSYLKNTTSYFIDSSNSIKFSTRENKTSDLTEYYNFMYQYKNDCLAASIEYNKDYYSDRELKPEESIFFKLTIIPIGETSSPNLNK
jgi:LPS-assembly protein